VSDWGSYDLIAQRYDDVWGPRFRTVAEHLWALISVQPGAKLLDVGTGTGLVPRALGTRIDQLDQVVGCDLSCAILDRARAEIPSLWAVAGNATMLPFREASFELATANFVLSHVPKYEQALAEVLRVLKPSGTFTAASWTASKDPYSRVWDDLVAEAVSKDALEQAVRRVAPWEGYFQEPENVRTALLAVGFTQITIHRVELDFEFSIESYLADREISSGGRYARNALGPDRWTRFLRNALEKFEGLFGEAFSYPRGVLIGIGRKA
jgi:ubiquinone/menaquinone biosynthesis C-methylase UbiE